MNELLVKELKMEELLVVDGGNCNWKDAGKDVLKGAIGGGIVGAWPGAGLGAIGGAIGYGATCWW